MSDPPPALINTHDPGWGYTLGQAALNAVQGCGFECERMYVGDGVQIEGLPQGCECQVGILVNAGFRPPVTTTDPGLMRQARITVVLDMCVVLPDSTGVPDPATVNVSAAATLTAREQLLTGLMRARAAGQFGMFAEVLPGEWVGVVHVAGMARWQTVWTVYP